jgi:predicted dienelactone hydrolase
MERGPYAAGERTWVLLDPVRERELLLTVWYPAVAGTATGAPTYSFQTSEVGADRHPGPFPVVLFSHGYSGFRFQSVFLTEFLATHGYVVVAPDHTGNTLNDQSASDAQSAWDRPQDLQVALDEVLSLHPNDPLHGIADAGRVAAIGHSFGAWTVQMLTGVSAVTGPWGDIPPELPPPPWRFRDERVGAVIPMTPGALQSFGPLDEAEIPVLFVGAELDATLPYATEAVPLWQGTPGSGLVTLHGAGHFTPSDMCRLLPNFGDGCGDGFLEPQVAHRLINAYTLAFLGRQLDDDARWDEWLAPGANLGEEADLAWMESPP